MAKSLIPLDTQKKFVYFVLIFSLDRKIKMPQNSHLEIRNFASTARLKCREMQFCTKKPQH